MNVEIKTTWTKDGVENKQKAEMEVENIGELLKHLVLKEKNNYAEKIDSLARSMHFPKKELRDQMLNNIFAALEPIQVDEDIECVYDK